LLFAFVFTLLVSYTAAGLASGLARSLAFTAAAFFGAGAHITSSESFDSFHLHISILNEFVGYAAAFMWHKRKLF